MSIAVVTNNVQVTRPVTLTLADHSGAHIILTVSIAGQPPIAHVFDFNEGELQVPLPDLGAGKFASSFTVQAFQHGALNRMYASALSFGSQVAGEAHGNIQPPATFDVGFGDFTLTVL